MELICGWFNRYFSNPQVVFLIVLLTFVFTVIIFMGDILAPVIAGVVIAYLLEGIVRAFERKRVPRLLAVMIVFLSFLTFLTFIIVALIPRLYRQLSQLIQQIPEMISTGQNAMSQLPELYPDYVTEEQIAQIMSKIQEHLGAMGQQLFSASDSIFLGSIMALVFVVLLPILVFFFLKDKDRIVHWMTTFFPKERFLAQKVWKEVDVQIGNYIRGKFWEVLVVWSITFMTFAYMGLQYAMLLGVLVGLSVIIPYVGVVVVTFPVVIIAFFQWGASNEFVYLMAAFFVIQALDGNILVPLLFSEVVNLHPIAIIVAILVFGGVWGFWGVFFAIPLATLVQSVISAWPVTELKDDDRAVCSI
ncbi:MAG: AI-2E family transporter [Methylococcales bacterium]|jgi:putative permease|nr:AI-2E family transporter [Methylococcales bacterium]MBT7410351.1 AI-2E family transporter [Methylococcales bacterium]